MENLELLRPLITRGILEAKFPKDEINFKSWISSGRYVIHDVVSTKELELNINDEFNFLHMLSYDCNRMACASFETVQSISPNKKIPKSYSWIAIQTYYAAFFSAHSIMRIFGFMCSQLEKGHVKTLSEYSTALGFTTALKIDSGYFAGKFDSNSRILSLKKMTNTHEDTWLNFIACLKFLSQNVLHVAGLNTKKQLLSSELDDLIDGLQSGGQLPNGSFLSKFRNAVNYRQEHSAWHPYGKNSIHSDKIMELIKNWQQSPMPSSSVWKESKEAYQFFYTSLRTINLCHGLVLMMMESSSDRNNLFRRGPNNFIKLLNS